MLRIDLVTECTLGTEDYPFDPDEQGLWYFSLAESIHNSSGIAKQPRTIAVQEGLRSQAHTYSSISRMRNLLDALPLSAGWLSRSSTWDGNTIL